jgi:hypothetical protein
MTGWSGGATGLRPWRKYPRIFCFRGFTVAALISLFALLFKREGINKRRPRAIVIILKGMTVRISNV